MLFFKLLSAPVLILILTLLVRKYGPRVGGLALGVPLVAGPISIFMALDHGAGFASTAAIGSLLGQASACVYCFAFAAASRRLPALPSVLAAVIAYAACAALLNTHTWTLGPALALLLTLALLGVLIPAAPGDARTTVPSPWWDLPLRLLLAPVIILTITTLSEHLSPQLSGIIAPVPVMILILGAFTLHRRGPTDAAIMMKAVVVGSLSFAAFFTVVAVFLREGGMVLVYLAAAGASVAVSGALYFLRRDAARVEQ